MAEHEARQTRDEVLAALQRDLEAACYRARRAEKQFNAADPDNRLVTQELERRWNQAPDQVREMQRRVDEQQQRRGQAPHVGMDDFAELASDLEAVWNDPQSDARLKKRIVRSLIREVVADVDREASEIVLIIHWKGGVHTELRVPRRRRGCCQATSKDIVAAVRMLAKICTDKMIAGILNRNSLRTGPGNRWTQGRVTKRSAVCRRTTAGRSRLDRPVPSHCHDLLITDSAAAPESRSPL